jgi:hypothetical protein
LRAHVNIGIDNGTGKSASFRRPAANGASVEISNGGA